MFHDEKRVCLLMEFVNAGELYRLIYKELKEPMAVETAQFFTAEPLLTLEELHRPPHNTIYRDLKPENILVSKDGHCKLVDFGLAKKLGPSGRTKTNCGTLIYQGPEILLAKDYTYSVDYWALGVLLFELLCRKVPWGDGKENPFKISQAIMSLNI